jgi:hypothetical protein
MDRPERRAMIKWLLIAFGVVAALAVCLCVAVDHTTHVAIVVGLGLGCLLGPVRIAGVDFRQWFREPGAPSELGDNSRIGLMRDGCHTLGLAGLLALLIFAVMVARTDPASCPAVDTAWLGASWLGGTLGALLETCSGFWAFMKVLAGALVGIAIPHAVIELTWRQGLRRVPAPARPMEYLATQPPPRLRPKVPHDGIRRLIVCCDGTWNWPDGKKETNVVRLVRAIEPTHDGVDQIVHYHEGVGTGDVVDRIVGGGTGVGLAASVKACYGFLVDNYREHDEIFLFGFSRGAYVVRALAGLIGTAGLMRKHEMDRFGHMWNWYWQKTRDPRTLDRIAPQRQQHVDIECTGVWDTVGALGIPGSRLCASAYQFFEAELGPHVRHAFQSLAIDERRGNFQGAVWVPYDTERPRTRSTAQAQAHLAAQTDEKAPRQVIRQVWFPGVHSNIGGGYPEHGMSDATFVWMLEQIDGLLGLNQACIVGALDRAPDEQYPGGKLEDSRSLLWKLIGAPIPRPVCVISATERVHESAWGRAQAAATLVPAKDVYKTPARRKWLEAMRSPGGAIPPVEAPRGAIEIELTGLPRPPADALPDIPPKRDLCSRVLALLRPQGG